MKVWDVSGFLGAWGYWPLKERTGEDVVALMDANQIECAVVGSTRALQSNWRLGNDDVLAAAADSAGRLIPFVTIDSTQGECDELLRDYASAGAKGVRCYPSMHYNTLPQQLEPLCAVAEELGLVVTLVMRPIMDWSFPVAPVNDFEFLLEAFPGIQFVLHGLNYGEETWNGIRLQNAHPNVWLETSCLQGLGGIAQLVAQGDRDRILLGVGIPVQYPACGIAKLEKAAISSSDKEAIAHLNAQRLLAGGG
jgi:hypothetical protein